MNWTRLSDRKPKEEDCPSGRVLVAFPAVNQYGGEPDTLLYADWGINSLAWDRGDRGDEQEIYWMPIPLLPGQQPFWWKPQLAKTTRPCGCPKFVDGKFIHASGIPDGGKPIDSDLPWDECLYEDEHGVTRFRYNQGCSIQHKD